MNVKFFLSIIYFPFLGCPEYFHGIIYATTFVLQSHMCVYIYIYNFFLFWFVRVTFYIVSIFRRDRSEFSAL